MMPYVDCVFAQRHLESFVDHELPVNDQVLVESHLRWCTTCAARVEDLQAIGMVIRSRGRREPMSMPSDRELSATRRELLRVSDAERNRSLESRIRELGRLCADLRFIWPAVGASAAVALCIGLAETMWRATAEQQPTSLAAMIESLSDPGSDRNPLRLDGAMLVPRVLQNQGAVAHAVLDEHALEGDDEVFAVAAVVTRDGKIGTYELLEAGTAATSQHRDAHNDDMADLLDAVRQSRFAPAQGPGGRTVAVNVVWLFAKTTVKASAMPVDLGVPLSAPVRSRRAVEVPDPAPAELAVPGERRRRCRIVRHCVIGCRIVSDGLTRPKSRRRRPRASPRARDVVERVGGPQHHTSTSGALGQAQLELLGPRVRDAVLRIHRHPAVAVQRVVHALHRGVVVAHVEGDDRPRALAPHGGHRDRRRQVVDVEGRALHVARERGGR